ncbi:MAG: MarR family transcriptional regulator [Bdellovibrionota bacterium]
MPRRTSKSVKAGSSSPLDPPIVSAFEIHPAMKAYFGYCLVKSGHRLRALLDIELRSIGISISELSTLRIVELSGPTSQVEIGRYMGMDRASVVKLIDGLEKKKLVRRTPHEQDRRVKLVVLTPHCKTLLKRAAKIREACENKFLEVLSPAERETLRKIIPKLLSGE